MVDSIQELEISKYKASGLTGQTQEMIFNFYSNNIVVPVAPVINGGSISSTGTTVTIVQPTTSGTPTPSLSYVVMRGSTDVTSSVVNNQITNAVDGTYTITWTATNSAGTVTKSASAVVSSVTYDPDAQAMFNRMSVQPDSTRKQLISDRFVAAKASTWWDKIDGLYVLASHDAQAGRLNWKQDLFNLSLVGSPVFTTDRGYAGASGGYLSTGFNPSTDTTRKYKAADAHLGVRTNGNIASDASVIGFSQNSGGNYSGSFIVPVGVSLADNWLQGITEASGLGAYGTSSVGLTRHYVVSRGNEGNGSRGYRTGAFVAGTFNAGTTMQDGVLRVCGGSNTGFNPTQISLAHFGGNLTDAEVTSMYNWFETYRSAVGLPTA